MYPQVLASIVLFLIHALQNGPLRQRREWRKYSSLTYEGLLEQFFSRASMYEPSQLYHKLKFALLSTYAFFTDGMLIFYSACLGAAALGILVSPFCFAFHLLDIITTSKDLQSVFTAVTKNGRSILATAFFGLIIVYIYAIIGYLYFSDSFAVTSLGSNYQMCNNLPICTVAALNEGLRAGDIGEFMNPQDPQGLLFYFQVAYQLSFWAIVITILLNVIFGIIIDTFGELRSDNLAKKDDMENICFICGVDRFQLVSMVTSHHSLGSASARLLCLLLLLLRAHLAPLGSSAHPE